MLENAAFTAKHVHQNLQKFYMMLKARNFSPEPLVNDDELKSIIRQLLEPMHSVSIVEGVLEDNERSLKSTINLLLEIAQRYLENGWDRFLLKELAESNNWNVLSCFETANNFDSIAERIHPEVFLHIYRMGMEVDNNINKYIDFFFKQLKASIVYSEIPVFNSEICSSCYGKKKRAPGDQPGDSDASVCPKCNGKGKIEEVSRIIILFYNNGSDESDTGSNNALIRDFWKHYSSTKIRLIGNAIIKSNFLGRQTRRFFESCNNDAIIKQYKISSPLLKKSSKTYWSCMKVFREHDRLIHLRVKLKKDERIVNRNPRDWRARKRMNKYNNALNSIYRANLEIFASPLAGTQDDNFISRSMKIGWGKYRWEKIFSIYHPRLYERNNEIIIDHFYHSLL
ncbi:MAG: hypothetical protein ACTSP4_10465 [Candidatus Hodarchaeales archaeon]